MHLGWQFWENGIQLLDDRPKQKHAASQGCPPHPQCQHVGLGLDSLAFTLRRV